MHTEDSAVLVPHWLKLASLADWARRPLLQCMSGDRWHARPHIDPWPSRCDPHTSIYVPMSVPVVCFLILQRVPLKQRCTCTPRYARSQNHDSYAPLARTRVHPQQAL